MKKWKPSNTIYSYFPEIIVEEENKTIRPRHFAKFVARDKCIVSRQEVETAADEGNASAKKALTDAGYPTQGSRRDVLAKRVVHRPWPKQ